MMYERISNLDHTEMTYKRKKYTILTKVFNFSDESIHRPRQSRKEFTDIKITECCDDNYQYPFKVYANGNNNGDKDSISIIFKGYIEVSRIEFTCFVSVIDVEKCERFKQSYCFVSDRKNEPDLSDGITPNTHIWPKPSDKCYWPKLAINNYLTRKILLGKAEELLPEDTLTLHMDLHIKEFRIPFENNLHVAQILPMLSIKQRLEIEKYAANGKFFIYFDSPLGKLLMENSKYFEKIAETPMVEKESGFVTLPIKEKFNFKKIEYILYQDPLIIFHSIDEIIDVYICSHYYDIPIVMETCKLFLKYSLTTENVSMISDIAHYFNDDKLVECIEMFVQDTKSFEKLIDETLFIFKKLESKHQVHNVPDSKDFFDLDIFK